MATCKTNKNYSLVFKGVPDQILFCISIESSTFAPRLTARMVKLVDTPDLGSGAARLGGSSPSPGTSGMGMLGDEKPAPTAMEWRVGESLSRAQCT